MGEGRKEAEICSLALAGTHTKYGFSQMLGDTDKIKHQRPLTCTRTHKTNKQTNSNQTTTQPKEIHIKRKTSLVKLGSSLGKLDS